MESLLVEMDTVEALPAEMDTVEALTEEMDVVESLPEEMEAVEAAHNGGGDGGGVEIGIYSGACGFNKHLRTAAICRKNSIKLVVYITLILYDEKEREI